MKIIKGDCLKELKKLKDKSVDAMVTDPPYDLEFMGKEWDGTGIAFNIDVWKQCLRVLKPGGHLLSFGGTRTYHRMAVAIEDAGFEIRDMLEWIYASGFPKSQNVGKAYDKIFPRLGQFDEFAKHLTEQIKKSEKTQKEIAKLFPSKTGGVTGCVWNWANGANVPTVKQWNILKPLLDLSDDFLPLIERIEKEREVVGKKKLPDGHSFAGERYTDKNDSSIRDITKGNSQWEGFGSALKPAHEPIVLARKPLSEKTMVDNCIKWGTGALDIDGCRIPTSEQDQSEYTKKQNSFSNSKSTAGYGKFEASNPATRINNTGRFPANILVTDDALNDGEMTKGDNRKSKPTYDKGMWGNAKSVESNALYSDSGSKSRYFSIDVWAEKHGLIQVPKASKKERNEGCEGLEEKRTAFKPSGAFDNPDGTKEYTKMSNSHPTCKPVHLMSWLIRLVSKEGDTVLDPFMGSGTTGVACQKLGRNFIGIEKEEEYIKIAKARIEYWQKQPKQKPML